MPLKLIFDNLIIPIHIIEEKYEGGFHEFYSLIRNEVYYFDEHLFTISSMSFDELFTIEIDKLNAQGFTSYQLEKVKGTFPVWNWLFPKEDIIIWKDVYITNRGSGRKDTQPEWISFANHFKEEKDDVITVDKKTGEEFFFTNFYNSVYLTGTNPGEKIIDKRYNDMTSAEYIVSDENPSEFMLKFVKQYKKI